MKVKVVNLKILIINDLLVYGGTEMQTLREKKILESNGNKVCLLTFDNNFPENDKYFNEENGFYNIKIENNKNQKVRRKFFVDKKLSSTIADKINLISPDIIHVNNLQQYPPSQYKALNGYKVVQTIRDYAAVCPLGTCINKKNEVCSGYERYKCLTSCGKSVKDTVRILKYPIIDRYKKKYIQKFLCPSEELTRYCKNYKFDIECVNNSFDFSKLSDFQKKIDFKKKKYFYFGNISTLKGVDRLLEAFNEFSKDKEVELILAGNVVDEFKEILNQYIGEKIKYIGYLKYDATIKQLEDVYCIIVPSLWMENYPNTVLEGLATGTLVIGSNRGGIPSMLSNNRGIVFDIMSKSSFIEVLERSYSLTIEQYESMTRQAREYVYTNNSMTTYYNRLIKVFNEMLEKDK